MGDRTWRTSRNVKKPVISHCYVSENEPLMPPPGASILDRTENQNSFGSFTHVIAMLPEEDN